MGAWNAANIPNLRGKTAVVTGANSGLGRYTALELARHGAHVVLACRDQGKGASAVDWIRDNAGESGGVAATGADGGAELAELDLADLASVRRFASTFASEHDGLDLLVNNAGVMAIPYRVTADGFEMQFGTNHLGHFALTAGLLPCLLARPMARVVTVSSLAHLIGGIHFADLQHERGYSKWGAYAQSKLANLLFAFELDRRAKQAGSSLVSVAAHPGYAHTNLQAAGPEMAGHRWQARAWEGLNHVIAQSAAGGALPSLYAATAPDVTGGQFFGPAFGMRGHPTVSPCMPAARNPDTARRLWEVSEQLTGMSYAALSPIG
jgi:NAD(P)-dependent dehydrogenase (short-subunit alcohol dehydrogenase family)